MKTDIHFLWSHFAQFLEWEMFQTKVVQKIKTHFMFNNFFIQNQAVYEIIWKNTVEPGRPQMTIWRMRIACWIPKATDTHSEYVIRIHFPCNNGWRNVPQCYVTRTVPVSIDSIQACTNQYTHSVPMLLYIDVSLPVEGIHKFSGNIAQFMPLKHTHVSVLFVSTWQSFFWCFLCYSIMLWEEQSYWLYCGEGGGGGLWWASHGNDPVHDSIRSGRFKGRAGSGRLRDWFREREAADIAVSDWL